MITFFNTTNKAVKRPENYQLNKQTYNRQSMISNFGIVFAIKKAGS